MLATATPSPDPRLFAALGDATRLLLVERLRGGAPLSTSALAGGLPISRQAVDKHLAVLAGAGLVRDERHGRERLWTLDPAPLQGMADWASAFRRHWEQRFDRLEALLAEPVPAPLSNPVPDPEEGAS